MNLPKISVNIPLITNGDASIVLNSLQKIDYPKGLYEIIIIEGKHLAKQRNIGLRVSKGEIIYLLDDDSQVQPESFRMLAKEFLNPQIGAVGGPSLTPKDGKRYLNQLIGYVLETYFGAFRMRYKWSNRVKNIFGRDYHFIGANLALRKKTVIDVGGFDETIIPNEETELLRRLQNIGYLLKFNKDLFIYRNQRKNLCELTKQFYHYGKGRMKQIKKKIIFQDFILFAPIAFGFYLLTLTVFHQLWYFFPLVAYLFLGVATAMKASIKYKKLSLLLTMPILILIVHLSYAAGMVNELLTKSGQNKKNYKININYAKRFIAKEKFIIAYLLVGITSHIYIHEYIHVSLAKF